MPSKVCVFEVEEVQEERPELGFGYLVVHDVLSHLGYVLVPLVPVQRFQVCVQRDEWYFSEIFPLREPVDHVLRIHERAQLLLGRPVLREELHAGNLVNGRKKHVRDQLAQCIDRVFVEKRLNRLADRNALSVPSLLEVQ